MFAAWSVRNRVAVNIFTVVLLIAGYTAGFTRVTRSIFPDVSTNFIRVMTLDPGTSTPEQIERTITVPVEEELADVGGLRTMTSFSQDNISMIFLEIDPSIADLDPVLNDVRQSIDKVRAELPATAEPPVAEVFEIPMPLLTLAVAYPPDFDQRKARTGLDALKRRLKTSPGVSEVLVDGLPDREIRVQVDPFLLETAGVTLFEVGDAIARRNVNAVGGRLDTPGGQRIVRLSGEALRAEDVENYPIFAPGGRLLRVCDIATVKEDTEEETTRGRINGRPAVTFTIVKRKGADAIETAGLARKAFREALARLPEGFEGQVFSDSTKFVNTRIETVLKNGVQALVLVTSLLLLFLNWRLALVVAFGIPVSFAGAFLVLYFGGFTINLLSLFAMILALGMVVDDAIVIAENVYRYYEDGMPPAKAAIRGTAEVVWPVTGSVSTTVAAFLPLMWGEGIIGKFLVIVPIVVISTLTVSLIQAFLVLPSHLADFLGHNWSALSLRARLSTAGNHPLAAARLQAALTYVEARESLDRAMARAVSAYLRILISALRHRYLAVAAFLASLAAVGVALALGVVKFQLFSGDFADQIMVKLELPAGASLDDTDRAATGVSDAIAALLPPDDLAGISSRIGARLDATDQFLEYGTNLAMLTVDIDEQNPLSRSPSAIERDLNALLTRFPEFSAAEAKKLGGGPPVGRAVNVQILGENFDELRAAAEAIEAFLSAKPGLRNIGNDLERGKTEFHVRVDDDRATLAGVDLSSVAGVLVSAYRGREVARMRWGNDEVTIRVQLDERYRHDSTLLGNLRTRARDGALVPIGAVADIVPEGGYARVKRIAQSRAVTVSADVDDRVITSAEVNRLLKTECLPGIEEAYPGIRFSLAGENEDTERSLAAMQFAAIVALLLIYALLATIANSFLQPLVIMAVIPFGIVGVAFGLIVMGEPMGLMAIMGTIALAGIVVNNAVVLVDFINRARHAAVRTDLGEMENVRRHPSALRPLIRWRSILLSGKTRFRPIFLTASTTVAGLAGLAFTTRGQEQFLAPMAQAIVFGLSFATLLTLLLIPCLYAILDDIKAAFRRRGGRADPGG